VHIDVNIDMYTNIDINICAFISTCMYINIWIYSLCPKLLDTFSKSLCPKLDDLFLICLNLDLLENLTIWMESNTAN
jgi:hypothetical protein